MRTKNKIAILTDTNSGLSLKQADVHGVELIPMPVMLNGETFFEHQTITQEEFFIRLGQGASVKTSQPAPHELLEAWERLLENHEQVVYIPMSSGLSGGYETASALAQEYEGRVYTVNNHRISVTLRQSVLEARYFVNLGKSAEEIVRNLKEDALNSRIYLTVNTLEYLKRSGRVTPAAAAIGTALNIKPVLQIQEGKLDAYRKVRGMNAAMHEVIKALKLERATRFANQKVAIRAAYAGNPEFGETWRNVLQEAFPDLMIEMDPLSVSVACHTGAGALGVGIMRDILRQTAEKARRQHG